MSDGKVMAVDRKRFMKLGGADPGLENWGAAGLGKQYCMRSSIVSGFPSDKLTTSIDKYCRD